MGDGTISEDEIGGILFISGYTLKDVALPSAQDRSRRTHPRSSVPHSGAVMVQSITTLGASARPVGITKTMEDVRPRSRPMRRPGEEDFLAVTDPKRRKRTRPAAGPAVALAEEAVAPSRSTNPPTATAGRTMRRANAAQPVNEQNTYSRAALGLNAHSRAALALSNITALHPPATARLSRSYLHVRIAWQIYYDRAVDQPLLEAKELAARHYRGTSVSSAFLTPTIQTQHVHPASVSHGPSHPTVNLPPYASRTPSYPTVSLAPPTSHVPSYPIVNLVPPSASVGPLLSTGLQAMFAVSHAAAAPTVGATAPGTTSIIIA